MARQKASTAEVEPNIKIRSQQVTFHHLFKGLVARMKKNVTPWLKGSPSLQDVEHVHFFHSIDSHAFPQEHTNEVGGHFHKVEWKTDSDGNLIATCGPALKKITRPGRNGLKTQHIVPVKFEDKFSEQGPVTIIDNHKHEMIYLGSDQISAKNIQDIQQSNAKAVARMLEESGDVVKPATDPTASVEMIENDR